MSVAFLKLANKWLLMGCVVLTPILSAANLEGAASRNRSTEGNETWIEAEGEDQLVERLQKLVIDFHDNSLLTFWSSFQLPSSVLINDVANIAFVINSMNPLNGPEFAGLLVNYYSAGSNYVSNIDNLSLCSTPNNASQLISEWVSAATLLADFISSRSYHSPSESAEIHKLFLDWTKAQITYLNNAAPQCGNPSSPVNAALSDAAYAQTRRLTYFIALEVFKTFQTI